MTCAGPVCPRGSNYLRCADRRTHCPPGAGLRTRTSTDKLERIRRVRSHLSDVAAGSRSRLPDVSCSLIELSTVGLTDPVCRSCPVLWGRRVPRLLLRDFYNPNLIHLTDNPVEA